MMPLSWETPGGRHTARAIMVGGCAMFLLLLIRTAWLDDDAYITFRTVDNFLNGDGLRWNVANRVQAYTHPLWMFAVTGAAAVTGEMYYASILLSIAVSLAAVALVATRLTDSAPAAGFALSAFALSKGFVDYSTSGLENPLTHLLLAGFLVVEASLVSARMRLLLLSVLAALLMLNRLDAGLLVLPMFAVEVWRVGLRRAWRPVAVGLAPLVAWEIFSLVYYGFLVPNTAYSKLQHGVPRPEILYQGFLYLFDSIGNDPLTLLIIFGAVVAPLAGGRGWTTPAGIVLYLAYVVWVGGDFMSGRFLTAPFLLAVVCLARHGAPPFNVGWALALGVVWLTGLSAPRPTIVSTSAYGSDVEPASLIAPTGITDERRYYYPQAGLLTARRGAPMPNHKWVQMGHDLRASGERIFSTDAAGFIGYAAGPGVHFIDRYGLGDALLARLPAEVPWRIGHFVRRVPEGYRETIELGPNAIGDQGVKAYYERLRLITEGPIWTRERWRTIWRMHTGQYEHYIASYGLVRMPLARLEYARSEGAAGAGTPDLVGMTLRGVEVSLGPSRTARALDLSVSRNDRYRIALMANGVEVHVTRLNQPMSGDGTLLTHVVDLPHEVTFDAVLVQPSGGDARYFLGHLKVLP